MSLIQGRCPDERAKIVTSIQLMFGARAHIVVATEKMAMASKNARLSPKASKALADKADAMMDAATNSVMFQA